MALRCNVVSRKDVSCCSSENVDVLSYVDRRGMLRQRNCVIGPGNGRLKMTRIISWCHCSSAGPGACCSCYEGDESSRACCRVGFSTEYFDEMNDFRILQICNYVNYQQFQSVKSPN